MRLTEKNTFLDVSGVTVGFGPDHDDATRRCSSCPPRCSAPTSSQQKAAQGGHRAAPAMPTYFTRGAKVALEWDPAGFTEGHGGRQADLRHGRVAWIAFNLTAILTSLSPRGAALAEDEFQVFVRTLAGTTVTLDLKASDTIGGVKHKIEDKHRVPARMQRLLFGRKDLDEDDCLIVDYGIAKECTLMLTGGLRGGGKKGAAPTPPFDASSAPPFECFFPDCGVQRDTYCELMEHIREDHPGVSASDFDGTFFGDAVRGEKKPLEVPASAASAAASAPAAENAAAEGATSAGAAPPPPFDKDSRPPFARWFPECRCQRLTYVYLMKHVREEHGMSSSDFNGTFFGQQVRTDKKKENDARKAKAAAAGPASSAEAAVPRQTWIACVKELWADDLAAGDKNIVCTVGKGRFFTVRDGDLIIIACSGAKGRVTAVCQAAAKAQPSSDPEDLRGMVLPARWDDLLCYLGGKPFTYIHIRRAWDVRGLRVTAEALVRDSQAKPLTRGWHQRFVCASKDDAVAARLLERIDGCQRHDHDLPQAPAESPVLPAALPAEGSGMPRLDHPQPQRAWSHPAAFSTPAPSARGARQITMQSYFRARPAPTAAAEVQPARSGSSGGSGQGVARAAHPSGTATPARRTAGGIDPAAALAPAGAAPPRGTDASEESVMRSYMLLSSLDERANHMLNNGDMQAFRELFQSASDLRNQIMLFKKKAQDNFAVAPETRPRGVQGPSSQDLLIEEVRKIARGGESVPVPNLEIAEHAYAFKGSEKSRTAWPWPKETPRVTIEGFKEYMVPARTSAETFQVNQAKGIEYLFYLLDIGKADYSDIGVVQALHDQGILEKLTKLRIMNPVFSWTRKMMGALKHCIDHMCIICDRDGRGPSGKAFRQLKATTLENTLKACTACRKEAKQARKELDEQRLENYMSLDTAKETLLEAMIDLRLVARVHEGAKYLSCFWQRVASVAMAWQMVIPGTFGRSGELNGLYEREVLESRASGSEFVTIHRHKTVKTKGKLGRHFQPAMWSATDCYLALPPLLGSNYTPENKPFIRPALPRMKNAGLYQLLKTGGRIFCPKNTFPRTNLQRKWITGAVRKDENVEKCKHWVAQFNAHNLTTGESNYLLEGPKAQALNAKCMTEAFFGEPVKWPSDDQLPEESVEETMARLLEKYGRVFKALRGGWGPPLSNQWPTLRTENKIGLVIAYCI